MYQQLSSELGEFHYPTPQVFKARYDLSGGKILIEIKTLFQVLSLITLNS